MGSAVECHHRLRNAMDILLHRNEAYNITFDGSQCKRPEQLKLSHVGELGASKRRNRCANLVRRKAAKLHGVDGFIKDVTLLRRWSERLVRSMQGGREDTRSSVGPARLT